MKHLKPGSTPLTETTLMTSTALSAFSSAAYMLLQNQAENRVVLENLDLVMFRRDDRRRVRCTIHLTPQPSLHQTLFRFLFVCYELT